MLDFSKKNENDILYEIYSLYQNKYDELMDYIYCEISSYLNGSTSELKRIDIEIKDCISTIKSRTDWNYLGGLFYQYNEYCYDKESKSISFNIEYVDAFDRQKNYSAGEWNFYVKNEKEIEKIRELEKEKYSILKGIQTYKESHPEEAEFIEKLIKMTQQVFNQEMDKVLEDVKQYLEIVKNEWEKFIDKYQEMGIIMLVQVLNRLANNEGIVIQNIADDFTEDGIDTEEAIAYKRALFSWASLYTRKGKRMLNYINHYYKTDSENVIVDEYPTEDKMYQKLMSEIKKIKQ